MRKVLVGFFILLAAAASAADYEIHEEYRQDVVDYESCPERFWRQIFSIKTDKSTVALLSHNYIQKTGEQMFTGFLNLYSPGKRLHFIVGNYNVGFGSGLFIGSRRYISDDPFAARPFPAFGNFLSPSGSANPIYSFMGFAAELKSGGETSFNGGAFVSLRRRYIRRDYYDSKRVPSSMNSINSRAAPVGLYNTPALIRDTGVSVSFGIGKNFSAGLIGYCEDLKTMQNETIEWEYKSGNSWESGVTKCGGGALYLRYSDKYIFMFCESGVTLSQKRPGKDESGTAISAGFRFRNPYSAFSLSALSAGRGFYAPEAADSPFPRNECAAALSLRALKYFEAGCSASYEKKEYPGRNESALSSTIREGVYILAAGKTFEVKAAYDEVGYNRPGGQSRMRKETASVKQMFGKKFSLNLKSVFQNRDGGPFSYSAGIGAQYQPFAFFTIGADGSVYKIRGPGIYSTVMPAENALLSSVYVNKTSASSVVKGVLKYNKMRFVCRYQQFYGGGFERTRFECAGQAVF